ncbi:hypothetical protein F5X96DRAFT_666840 [Biscogniauxia mediterranea]|nr:hypothetical protein F5X96DRAFT_666840 [Biscogniauxia mediterranea]
MFMLPNAIVNLLALSRPLTPLTETYLHPNLRVPAHERQRYEIKYEIYAFGLLLAKIAAASSPRQGGVSAEGLRAGVTSKCDSDLACWMGEKYRDIALRCLQVGANPNGPRPVEDLTGFYWTVVLELVRCAERVKVFESA